MLLIKFVSLVRRFKCFHSQLFPMINHLMYGVKMKIPFYIFSFNSQSIVVTKYKGSLPYHQGLILHLYSFHLGLTLTCALTIHTSGLTLCVELLVKLVDTKPSQSLRRILPRLTPLGLLGFPKILRGGVNQYLTG